MQDLSHQLDPREPPELPPSEPSEAELAQREPLETPPRSPSREPFPPEPVGVGRKKEKKKKDKKAKATTQVSDRKPIAERHDDSLNPKPLNL